jgi:hypothetical protein
MTPPTKPEYLFSEKDFHCPDSAEWLHCDAAARTANDIHEERCPYKARPDNSEGNEYSQVMALRLQKQVSDITSMWTEACADNKRLREALTVADKCIDHDDVPNARDLIKNALDGK